MQRNQIDKYAGTSAEAFDIVKQHAIVVLEKFDSDIGLAVATNRVDSINGYAIGRRSFCTIVNRNQEVLSKFEQIDTTAPSIMKNRISLNSINLLRKYLLMAN